MEPLTRYLIVGIAALGAARLWAEELPTVDVAAAAPADAAAADPLPADPAPVTDAAAATPVAAATTVTTAASAASSAAAGATGAFGFAEADRLILHKAKRLLELLKDGAVIAAYPIRLGLNPAGHKMHEGDFRTPEGHYYLSRRNPRSDYFLSIEVSYPNDADRRRARGNGKQPGGSIMIHGLPNVPRKTADYYVRNDWTDGCIAVSNSDMVDIWLRTRVGLPIDIRP
jgi:murein L,D-transpeptidase YafK